jgi:uncharacterized repeat protein (TIGR01451 family)
MSRHGKAGKGSTAGAASHLAKGVRRHGHRLAIVGLVVAALGAVWTAPAFGEGSVDFNTGPDAQRRNTMVMAGGEYTVLRVYARAGETVQMASSAMQTAGGVDDILVYAPGTSFASSTDPSVAAAWPSDPVFSTDIFDCNVDDAGTGRINSRAQELAGPAPNPGGYTPCEFTAPADGIYPIIMVPTDPAGTTSSGTVGTPGTGGPAGLSTWDVTVRDAGSVVQPGRLFSYHLALLGGSVSQPLLAPDPAGYFLTPTGYQYRFSFFVHQTSFWDLTANARGVIEAMTGARTFASFQYGGGFTEAIAPQLTAPDVASDSRFPIFFRPVDPVTISGAGGLAQTRGYATAPISPSTALSGLTFTGAGGAPGATAQGSGGTISFASQAPMNGLGYTTEIDLNQNGTFGDANDVVNSTADLSSAGNSFAWDGRDANGATPPCGSYAYRVRSTVAEAHLTQGDVEQSAGTQIERLTLPSDPALGDPLAANYNDVDPYKATAVTDAAPGAVDQGVSSPTFHAWTSNTGNNDFVDTWVRLPDAVASGTLHVCLPPPTATTTAGPAATTPATPHGGGTTTKPRPKPRLTLTTTVNRTTVRAGDTVTFTLRVHNPSTRSLRSVRVCDRLPAGLALVRATPASRLSNGRYCWTIQRLGGRASKTFTLTVRALRGTAGLKVASAAASSRDARADRASRTIRVLPARQAAGGVTG